MNENKQIRLWLYGILAGLLLMLGAVIIAARYVEANPAKISSYCAGNQTRVFVSDATSHFEVMWDESCS